MQVKDTRSGIFRSSNRSSNRTEGNQDRIGEDKRCIELANSKRSQRYTEVSIIGKLLLSVYSRFYKNSQTITWHGEKWC